MPKLDAHTLQKRSPGSASGIATLDSSSKVVETANNATDSDTIDTFHASQTVGTANTILVAGTDGTMPIQPIWNRTVTLSAVTNVTTDGTVTLDGNTHGGYRFEFVLYNSSASTTYYRLYYNNDTTNTNYYISSQYGGATHAGLNANDAYTHDVVISGARLHGVGDIIITPDGYVSTIGIYDYWHSTIEYVYNSAHRKKTTISNLTRIDITASITSAIGINSRFRLWRRL